MAAAQCGGGGMRFGMSCVGRYLEDLTLLIRGVRSTTKPDSPKGRR